MPTWSGTQRRTWWASLQSEQSYARPDGQVVWVLHGVATAAGSDGAPGWYAVSAQDITERRHAEQELRELTAVLSEQAVRDPLTGLVNRALLAERLRSALATDVRTGESTGVLFLDLDGFKEVNDRHGHAVGDAVLRGVAQRLRAAVAAPLQVHSQILEVGVSVGVARAARGDADPQGLLSQADSRMYDAKRRSG